MTTSVTLFVPGLFLQLSARETPDCPSLPTLERLLARADRSRVGGHGKDDCLLQLFGIDSRSPPPAAALSWLADHGPATDPAAAQHGWLRADPVHLHPDRDRLLLFDASQLRITTAETQALAETLSNFLAEDGITLHTPQTQRWYLQMPRTPALQTSPLEQVSGRDILPYMPTGEDGGRWRQRLNEVQMLLFQHPVNERREQRGQPTINSLWFWGNGQLPPAPTARYSQVFSDDPITRGLASLSQTPLANKHDLVEAVNTLPEGDLLLQYADIHSAQTLGDPAAWQGALVRLQTNLLAPLLSGLAGGRLDSLTLLAADGWQYRSQRRNARRWWRRNRPYHSYLKTVRDSSQQVPASTGTSRA